MATLSAEIKVDYHWTSDTEPNEYQRKRLQDEAASRLQYFLKEGYREGELIFEDNDQDAGETFYARGWLTITSTGK